jgi:two-component system, OmpR family, KDP operon response regulator KdpE
VSNDAPPAPEAGAASTHPVIVVIEDETQIRRFLRATLTNHDFRCFEATTGAEGLIAAASRQPDLILLDLGPPDLDGVEIIRRLREWTSVPIIVLSARDQEQDKVVAIDTGADDYVTKPFGVGELLARIRAALRHAAMTDDTHAEPVFVHGALRVDLARRHVFVGDVVQDFDRTKLPIPGRPTYQRNWGKVAEFD